MITQWQLCCLMASIWNQKRDVLRRFPLPLQASRSLVGRCCDLTNTVMQGGQAIEKSGCRQEVSGHDRDCRMACESFYGRWIIFDGQAARRSAKQGETP